MYLYKTHEKFLERYTGWPMKFIRDLRHHEDFFIIYVTFIRFVLDRNGSSI